MANKDPDKKTFFESSESQYTRNEFLFQVAVNMSSGFFSLSTALLLFVDKMVLNAFP
jgi:hypothetical protein